MTLEEFRSRRSAEKHRQILAAARTLFSKEGFGGASIEAVALRAGVSTATVYARFGSKAALFKAVAESSLRELGAALEGDGETAGAQLQGLARRYAAVLTRPEVRGIMRALIAEVERDHTLSQWFYSAIKTKVGDLFVRAIVESSGAGAFDPIGDPALAAGHLQGMIEHATLLRGLILGDASGAALETDAIADAALVTFSARWRRRENGEIVIEPSGG